MIIKREKRLSNNIGLIPKLRITLFFHLVINHLFSETRNWSFIYLLSYKTEINVEKKSYFFVNFNDQFLEFRNHLLFRYLYLKIKINKLKILLLYHNFWVNLVKFDNFLSSLSNTAKLYMYFTRTTLAKVSDWDSIRFILVQSISFFQ